MRRGVFLTAVSAVVAVLSLLPAAPSQAAEGPTDRYIVTLSPLVGDVAVAADLLLDALGAGEVVQTYEHALTGFVVELPSALAPALDALPLVLGVEADGLVTRTTSQPNAPWGLDRIDQRTLPLSGTYEYGPTGKGVDVYVIDSGINAAHVDFGGRVVPGFNAVPGLTGTSDCDGHGTHVAGTIGGAIHGVAKQVRLIPIRVFGCEASSPTSVVIAGIDEVARRHTGGPAVANLSLGGGASTALDDAIRGLVADGVVTAVAAGNSNTDACTGSPSRVPEVLTVGSSDRNDNKAASSSHGPCVDLFAPGVAIVSASNESSTGTRSMSGTSMATPHVAGAAALYLEDRPTAPPSQVHGAIVGSATPGRIGGLPTGPCDFFSQLFGSCAPSTANLLLHTTFTPPTTPPPTAPPPACNFFQQLLGQC